MKKLLTALFLLAPLLGFAANSGVMVNDSSKLLASPTNFLDVNMLRSSLILVNKAGGNNATARKYTLKPFADIYASASNAASPDTILADPGDYVMSTVADTVKLPDNVNLIGHPGTFISWTNDGDAKALLIPGNNSVVKGIYFRAYTPIGSGLIQKIITTTPGTGSEKYWRDAKFIDCDFEGQTDTYGPFATTPVSTRFYNCRFKGFWDALVTGGSPHYGEWNNCTFVFDGQGRGNYDPEQITIDYSGTILKTSSGCTNVFNFCTMIVTNMGLPTTLDLSSGAYILQDGAQSNYNTNFTIFNSCNFAAAGSNVVNSIQINFPGNMFSGKETNAWVNSNHVVLFYNCARQTIYPPSYGMHEANTYCGSWGDGNVMLPNAATRIYRLPNAGPNGKPFFKGQQINLVDYLRTATGTNISITTRVGQTIDGSSSSSITVDGGSRLLEVGGLGGTNWFTVNTLPTPGSGGGATTNATQFGAAPALTIKNGALLTNVLHTGTFTNIGNITNTGELRFPGFSISSDGANAYLTDMASATAAINFTLGSADASFGGNVLFQKGITVPTLTSSRAAIINSSGNLTNAGGTPDGTKFLRDDGVYAAASGGSGGTNYPPAIANGGGSQAHTNIVTGSAVRQVVTIVTNASFKLTFSGTPLNGESIKVGVSNYAASTIYVTNTAFDPTTASNATLFAVPATSVRWFDFLASTNWNQGTVRWEIVGSIGKEMEIGAGNMMRFDTNAAGSLITVSVGNAVLTNLAGNVSQAYTNPVIINLVGTVAKNVTNENSTALQIDTGTLTLSPGVLSNIVASAIDVPASQIVSNVGTIKFAVWTNYVQTVSNFVFSFNTNRYELKNQTNVVFTNLVEEATAVGADMTVHIHNTTGVTMGLVWPAYGAQHGYFLQTNANNPILTSTSLTTGKHGVASFTAFGTNIFATWSEWP